MRYSATFHFAVFSNPPSHTGAGAPNRFATKAYRDRGVECVVSFVKFRLKKMVWTSAVYCCIRSSRLFFLLTYYLVSLFSCYMYMMSIFFMRRLALASISDAQDQAMG